jgi:dienelactone hydrolase
MLTMRFNRPMARAITLRAITLRAITLRAIALFAIAALALSACGQQGGGVVGTRAPLPPGTAGGPYPGGAATAQATSDPEAGYPCPGCRPTIVIAPVVQDVGLTVDGTDLRGTYYTPDFTPAPGVLLLHQVGGSSTDYTALAKQLQSVGFTVLAIDFRGHGATGGEVDWEQTRADITKLLDWLAAENKTNGERISVVGASIGANLALVTAAEDPRVKNVVLLSPGLDYEGIRTEDAAGRFGGPLMLVASSEDTESANAVPRLAELHPGAENILQLENAGHGTEMLSRNPDLATRVIDWLQTTVQ